MGSRSGDLLSSQGVKRCELGSVSVGKSEVTVTCGVCVRRSR